MTQALLCRRRSGSFSLMEREDSSFSPGSHLTDSILEDVQTRYMEPLASSEVLLSPEPVSPRTEEEQLKLSQVQEMCADFSLSDEQLQHIEKRMIMEINWGLGRHTNSTSNIKSYITYVSQLPTGREAGQYLALDLGGTNFRCDS